MGASDNEAALNKGARKAGDVIAGAGTKAGSCQSSSWHVACE